MSKGVLRNLRVKRVAIVDMGANFDKKTGDGAHVMLWKSMQKDGPSIGDVHVDSTGGDDEGKKKKAAATRPDESTNDKEKPVKKSWKSLMKDFFGANAEADPTARAEKLSAIAKAAADMSDDGDEDDKEAVHKATDPMCKCADCLAKRANDPIAKSMEALQKRVEDAEARAMASETITKGLVEKAERDAVVTILKGFRAIPVDMTKDVEKFYEMKKTAPAVFDRTIEIMKATDEQLAQSELFKMHGSNGGPGTGGDAWTQIEAKAAAIVAKGEVKVTKEQALDMVLTDPANKDLVKRYREQQQ